MYPNMLFICSWGGYNSARRKDAVEDAEEEAVETEKFIGDLKVGCRRGA